MQCKPKTVKRSRLPNFDTLYKSATISITMEILIEISVQKIRSVHLLMSHLTDLMTKNEKREKKTPTFKQRSNRHYHPSTKTPMHDGESHVHSRALMGKCGGPLPPTHQCPCNLPPTYLGGICIKLLPGTLGCCFDSLQPTIKNSDAGAPKFSLQRNKYLSCFSVASHTGSQYTLSVQPPLTNV